MTSEHDWGWVRLHMSLLDIRDTRAGKLISAFLSFAMVFSLANVQALADEGDGSPAEPAVVEVATEEPVTAEEPAAVQEAPMPEAEPAAVEEPAEPAAMPEDPVVEVPASEDAGSQGAAADAASPDPAADAQGAEADGLDESADISSPAFEGYASVGSITVKVTAGEGVLPEGTTVTAAWAATGAVESAVSDAVEARGGELRDYVAIDVTLLDAAGNAIQPSAAVNVTFINSNVEGDNISVFRVSDDASVVERIASVRQGDNATQSFDVAHFTIYAVVGDDDPAIATYNFHDAAGNVTSTQAVKDGETLYSPATPEKDGATFVGWATSADATEAEVEPFDSMTAAVGETATIDYYPVYREAHYVFFMDKYGRVATTKEGIEGDSVLTTDVTLALSTTEGVTGWYYDEGLTELAGSEVVLGTEDITLYPKIEEGSYLYFSTGDGASYVAPTFFAAGQPTTAPSDPTRPGYDFVGWTETEGGTSADYAFDSIITENTTLYAVWSPRSDTPYTVIIWKQSTNDSKYAPDDQKTYDYEASEVRYGTSGEAVSATSEDTARTYIGFHYGRTSATPTTIEGDGTTVLNVYYDRDLLTIRFYTFTGMFIFGSWNLTDTYTGLYGQTLEQNGYTWPDRYHWYANGGSGGSTSGTHLTFLDAFIFTGLSGVSRNDIVLTQYGTRASGNNTASFYRQNLDGTYETVASNVETVSGNNATFYFTNKYTGFTIDAYRTRSGRGWGAWVPTTVGGSVRYSGNIEIRFRRNSYTLSFYSHNGTARTESVYYEAPLSDFAGYVPSRPSDLPEAYEFQGWYKDPDCTEPFDFGNTTMPASGLMIYAKWSPRSYTATIHLAPNGEDADAWSLEVPYGEKVSQTSLPMVVDAEGNVVFTGNGDASTAITMPQGSRWAGWVAYSAGKPQAYNFDTQTYRDVDLYPLWISTDGYSVTYTGEGEVTTSDSRSYATGSQASIQNFAGTAPEGKVFLYWTDGTNDYYPQDKITIAGDVELTAVYGDQSAAVNVVYNSNYSEGAQVTYEQIVEGANNTLFQVLGLGTTGIAAPAGYYLASWNTEPDGSGTSFAVGDSAGVDNDGAIANDTQTHNLYAQWERKVSIVVRIVGKNRTVPYNGKTQSVTGYSVVYVVDGVEVPGLPEDLVLSGPSQDEVLASGVNVGTYPQVISADDFDVVGDNAYKYEVTIETIDGSLTIEPVADSRTTRNRPALPKTGDAGSAAAVIGILGAGAVATGIASRRRREE